MTDTANNPAIRFRGFSGDWENQKLKNIYAKIRNAFVGTASPYYVEQGYFYLESNNVKDGAINRVKEVFINHEFYEKQKDNWLHTGDLVMVQSGHVGHCAVIPPALDKTAAHALIMFANPLLNVCSYFLCYQLYTEKKKNEIAKITTGNTIKHILSSDMKDFDVFVPAISEQTKIGALFSQLDTLITQRQRKYDKLITLKKALLNKMFPQQGETVPAIRFKGFSEAWEEKRINQIALNISDGDWIEADHVFDFGLYRIVQTGNIGLGEWLDKSNNAKYFHQKDFDELKANEIFAGDILISRLAEPAGRAIVLPKTGFRMVTAVDVTIIRPEPNKFDSSFFVTAMNSHQTLKRVSESVSGTSHKRISRKNLEEITIKTPNLVEQTKIGALFAQLDHLINLQQKELDKLKILKKALLNKVFV